MAVLAQAAALDPAENWDEDFEFNNVRPSRADALEDVIAAGATTPLSKDRKNTLKRWTEPGPSTPSKRSSEQPENWDDDFHDGTGSPARSRPHPRHLDNDEADNWDDDFEDGREGHSPRRKTPRRNASWGSSDEEDDYGFGDREEDRTVTSRSRRMPLTIPVDIPPPVPPLPSPFPRSPTASVFSMPVSSNGGRDSVAGHSYSSTGHLALGPMLSAGSSALALLPPSPPIHRERRRLRKKSRPPPAMGPDIYELDDRVDNYVSTHAVVPSTPEKKTIALTDDAPSDPVASTSAPGPAVTSNKTPLLSRIGSVGKKWGAARKKRASTGPSEVVLHESQPEHEQQQEQPSRPQSVVGSAASPPTQKGGWFFRGGGGGGPGPPNQTVLRHESSVDRLLALAGIDRGPDSPSRKGKGRLRGSDGESATGVGLPAPGGTLAVADGSTVSSAALFFGDPKRPTSMQIQPSLSNSNSSSGSSWASSRPPVPRHASYGHDLARRPGTPSSRSSSKPRSASASAEDVVRSQRSATVREGKRDERSGIQHSRHATDVTFTIEKGKEKEKEGSRSFMGGMRRISLGGSTKHKRTKSSLPTEAQRPPTSHVVVESEALQDQTTPRPPSRVIRTSQDGLLPPIELQPPSPPRIKSSERSSASSGRELRSLFRPHPTLEPSRSHPALSSRSSTPIVSRKSSSPSGSPNSSPLPSPTRPKPSSSPQVASLGRATQIPKERETSASAAVPRRNSLGDLKIPPRISQAQVGLRRDLGMVREFATSVEQLKQLQATYQTLIGDVHSSMGGTIAQTLALQSRALTPTLFGLPKPPSRSRSNTNPAPSQVPLSAQEFVLAFRMIESRYQLSWECAELLIDLGSGASSAPTSSAPASPPPPMEQAAIPAMPTVPADGRKSRERAVTLAGDEPKPHIVSPSSTDTSPPLASPPATTQWRASTGRHDLSSRQLLLLREMLNNPDPSATMALEHHLPIPEEDWSGTAVNRNWRWGDAAGSTVTLPSEDGTQASGSGTSTGNTKQQKRRSSRLRGIRDMLKSLKKSYSEGPPTLSPLVSMPASSVSISASTDSSLNNGSSEFRPRSLVQRRRAKTSTGPESMKATRERDKHPNSPYGTSVSLSHRSSPRRPSLASIFRLGQKSKPSTPAVEHLSTDLQSVEPSSSSGGSGRGCKSGGGLIEEEDWHRVESASDLERAAHLLHLTSDGTATVRGRKGKSPYLTQQQRRDHESEMPGMPGRSPTASQSSIWSVEASPWKTSSTAMSHLQSVLSSPTSRLRQFTEKGNNRRARPPSRGAERSAAPSPSPKRPPSRNQRGGSVRSEPPQSFASRSPELNSALLPDSKLAMTPENIKPLLENAREVHARCSECIVELKSLLASLSIGSP